MEQTRHTTTTPPQGELHRGRRVAALHVSRNMGKQLVKDSGKADAQLAGQ